ncbi:murein hydrolase activator EnvC family protein [Polluticoccus soli]|uniref:murein hydrolase activator EnvC family protein n=1 Tax=Polluticoccus soli TaxID=3034150 RepID=UPI0023E22F6A|nr:peptidoglycan DD-metalloendopeptidase family protein [Flavipsychrobacter sp. JY13-12]
MRVIALAIITLLFSLKTIAQPQPTRADLEKRRQSILESIRQTQEQLEETKKDKNATMGQLRALQNKLTERQRLIRNINDEIGHINNSISKSNQEVSNLKENLATLKMRYAQSLRYAYMTRSSYDMLAFLFSSNDFNEALRRMRYLKKYRDYRKQQADKIRVTQGEIVRKIDVLNSERTQKDMLLTAEMQQKQVLQKETDETNDVVKELKGREKELVTSIERDRKAARQLDRAVADIIRREMELARKKAEEEARRRAEEERKRQEEAARREALARGAPGIKVGPGGASTPSTTPSRPSTTPSKSPVAVNTTPAPKPAASSYSYSMTPEVAALSNSFEANRGKLPWPVEKGFISEGFGKHQHPVAEKVTVENYGVDIRTSPGSTARSVFEGTVTKVFFVDGLSWNVLINHGRYYTLYSRLTNVTVKKDQQVHTKQAIGTVGADDQGETMMNFQIWKDGNKLDPAGWIAR